MWADPIQSLNLCCSVVCILSGGNINVNRLASVVDRGMAAEGRLVKFVASLPDAPGAMAKLLNKVTDSGADVKSFVPERAWMRRDVYTVCVSIRRNGVRSSASLFEEIYT